MLGKTGNQLRREEEARRSNFTVYLSLAAIALAIAGLFTPNSALFGNLNASSCTQFFGARTVMGLSQNVDSISAYDLWLTVGNKGTVDDFLDSLVGEKGKSGFNGKNGESAYEVWLNNGNQGSTEDFFAAIAGKDGETGASGLNAYELWISLGNQGSLTDFMNSLVGATGATGEQGPVGAAGTNGVCTIGVGYYGYFWDETTQPVNLPVTPIKTGMLGSANGVSVNGSKITFEHSGTYNIAFSAQLVNQGGSKLTASIWLMQNGQNVPYTNTNIGLTHSVDEYVAAWNFFVDVTAGDYVEIVIHSSNGGLVILAQPETTNNGTVIPGIPSMITTVNQVR